MPTTNIQLDPSHPDFKNQVEQTLIQWEEEYAIETYPAEHRSHLGASAIGEECWRKLWYDFRWVKLNHAEGRMRRLWQRGKDEEEKFEAFLLWAGFNIRSINPITNKQYVFSKVNGHYGGSTDGKLEISWARNFSIIVEYKTFADKYFIKLEKEGVKISQPKYYAQMCSYGKEFEVKWALFYAVNKDNDKLYRELIELDWNYAIELEKKATDIIYADVPPNRISEQAAFWKCKFCHHAGICHYGELVERNCRSCKFATPVENANWKCNKFGQNIPKDFIKTGCQEWTGVV